MKGVYPSLRYHPNHEPKLVMSAEEHAALGAGWVESPAEYGVETQPGLVPDPAIAAKKLSYEKSGSGAVETKAPSKKKPQAHEGGHKS